VYNQVLSKMPEPTLGLYMIQTVGESRHG